MTIHDRTLSRRSILKAGAGLVIGVYIAAPVVRGAVAKANRSPDPVEKLGRHFGQPASGP
jgi:hypothetical protein